MGKAAKSIFGKMFAIWVGGLFLIIVAVPSALWLLRSVLWVLLAGFYLISGTAPEGFWG